ncbi:MAG: family 43 glycosylhydrolase [Bacteroidales bacterium]|nr:family 43 glycosylhydrolase [Bacteroidales bacterium]
MIKKLLAFALAASAISVADAVNPYLPLWEYIPDGEPYVFEDPDNPGQYRVYVYGSHDSLVTEYCGREQVVWSAPVDDPNNWRYDGVIFESRFDANGNPLNPGVIGDVLYAPDVALVTEADGSKTYYLYPNNQAGGRNGQVAKSKRPDGPFEVCNWKADAPDQAEGPLGFDPAVFVDDDGRVYAYWGFGTSNGAELDPATMATVKPGTEVVQNLISGFTQEGVDRFYEASSMRKIDGKYVLIYSRWSADGDFGLPGSNYTLAYCYGDNPLGPFTYGGTIIDGRGRKTLADGTVISTATPSGNTHGSIAKVGDQWYVFYHRQTGLNEFSRQAMVAPIDVEVTADGKVVISEGEYTSEGFQIEGLPLQGSYPAGIACYYTGPEPAIHAWPSFIYSGSYITPTYYPGNPRSANSDVKLRSTPVVNNTDGSTVGYKYFNFDTLSGASELPMSIEIMPKGIAGEIKVMAVAPTAAEGGIEVGSFAIDANTNKAPTTLSTTLTGLGSIKGKQPLFLLFSSPQKGVSICDLYSFSFD